ncbi:MAG: lysozyme inhibitor LprI family protein [Crocinitomicaceae bacterium]
MTKTILATSLLFFFISCGNKEIKKTPISSTNETEINLETEEQNTESFEHEIDKRFDDCINENGCTVCYEECTVKAIKEWRSEMNKYYNLLLENLDEPTKEKLILSQKKWLEYSEFELQFSNEFYGNMSGTIWGGVGLAQSKEKIKSRALELKAHYDAITGDAVRRPS